MESFLRNIELVEILKVLLMLAVFVIVIIYIRAFGGNNIEKPFAWQNAIDRKLLSAKLLKVERNYSDKVRFYNLWLQVERLKRLNIPGAFAELGVYRGETAKAIHYMDEKRIFYLFDTFQGFIQKDLNEESSENQRDGRFSTTMFANTNIEEVMSAINGNDKLKFRPGIFPDTTEGLENEKFALVNVDADLYAPTIKALHFFYPRMVEGGVIIIHDYNHNWDGVTKAINEFMPAIPESLVEIPDWQGSAMIIKNG